MGERATPRLSRLLIEAMAKHLPPSASRLRVLDINGAAGAVLASLRQDLDVQAISGDVGQWSSAVVPPASYDAVVAYGYALNAVFLALVLDALRPGGRLIVVNPNGEVMPALGQQLEQNGYVRILVETAAECPLPTGVLMRGEKAHSTADTHERVLVAAAQDADALDWSAYKGHYVHLLIAQTPNKPAWRLLPGEVITWSAAAVESLHGQTLLAFSSLPKAVAFMQPSVMEGRISGVNKVAKFSRAAAMAWAHPFLLNPAPTVLSAYPLAWVAVDMGTAEASDEA